MCGGTCDSHTTLLLKALIRKHLNRTSSSLQRSRGLAGLSQFSVSERFKLVGHTDVLMLPDFFSSR